MKQKHSKIARSARKLATKGSGKKWKKGQCSSSNPTKSAHRDAARNRIFGVNLGPSDLTVAAVHKHNQSEWGDADVSPTDFDNQSRSARTFSTWASNWTNSTNMTFNKVHRNWTSNDGFHKEVLAVLAAITEVIKENNGTESDTEYFAALITSMEGLENEESLAAIVYLLSLVVKKVPSEVLKTRFSTVAKKLMEILNEHAQSESASLLKSLLKSLAALLRAQDLATWNEASTAHVYNTLLSYLLHPKPKVRKQAHQCICSVLKGSEFMLRADCPSQHPAASQTAKYCIQTMELLGGGKTSGSLHILGLLKDVLGVLPKHSVKAACETVLKLMTLSDVVTKSVCMQALHGLFLSRPKPTSLPAELNVQIIAALYDYRPGVNDAQPLSAWLAVMQQAHINLVGLNQSLCLSHLPRFVNTCMQCMLAEREDGVQASADTVKLMIEECLAPCMSLVKNTAPPKMPNTPVHKIYQALEAGLSYQYHNAWDRILNCLSGLIQVLGKEYHNIVTKSLSTMADLRESHGFGYKVEVDHTFKTSVRTFGPKIVLSAVPLLINGDDKDNLDFPRSWLMPILRDSIEETELAFFIEYFLPLAERLKARAGQLVASGMLAGANTYEILHRQVWSLLPGFCTKPTDLKKSFKNLAKVLGSAINTKSELQLESMASLRKLILQNKDHEENREELARFAKNYLPILFNLYSTDPEQIKEPVRVASLETIRFYMQITPHDLVSSFYDKAFSKLTDESASSFTRHALMDLVNTMLMYISPDRLSTLYQWIVPNLKSKDRTTQKKAYRALEEICGSDTPACRQFVRSNVTELKTILTESLSTAHASSKAPRLRCLINIFRNLEDGDLSFIQTIIPEAILCTKETAERARAAAILLLIEMCEAGARWMALPKRDVVVEYFKLIVTGLEGSQARHISTTLLALTHLVFHYRAEASTILLDLLCDKLCKLLSSKPREIVESAIGLLKVLIGSFKDIELAKYLQNMVGGLVSMKDDNHHHFRFKAKEVFERLVRKFGYETIRKMVPESQYKFINNIRKTQERAKRRKKEMAEQRDDYREDYREEFRRKSVPENIEDFLKDSDSEIDDSEKPANRSKRSEKGKKTWLRESDENDMVDFLDKSAAQKIMATEPVASTSRSQAGIVKHDFKTAPDGRLIITVDEDNEESENSGKKGEKSDINVNDIMEAMDMKSGQKKRKRDAIEDGNDDEMTMKYKPGGSGIHRPVATAVGKSSQYENKLKKSKVSGEEYKAKKAKGDVKLKGKPDPYAYVPLNFTSLNRRKQAKLKGQFGSFVKSAKKGAMAGRKSKAKKGRK